MELKFLNPHWLLFIPLTWIIIWFFCRRIRRNNAWNNLFDDHLLNILLPEKQTNRSDFWLELSLVCLFTLGLIAVAGPSWRYNELPLFKVAKPQVLVLDMSTTMLAEDLKPARYQRAIYKAHDWINLDSESDIGLVVFSGAAFVVSPLTDDRTTLANFLDSLNPHLLPVHGSRADLAILMAIDLLTDANASTGEIVMISDGISDIKSTISAAKKANSKGYNLSILAIGTEDGGPIKDASGALYKDANGEIIIARTNLAELNEISLAGGGEFARFSTANHDLEKLLKKSTLQNKLDSQSSEDKNLKLPINDGIWIVLLLLPIALLMFKINAIMIFIIVVSVPFSDNLYAFDWQSWFKRDDQRAYEHLENKEYDKAYQLTNNSLVKGITKYKTQNYENADQAFAESNDAKSHYNRGNTLAHLKEFEQAIAAYNQAIKLKDDYEDAKFNKKLIEQFLENQRSQDNNQSQNNDHNDKNENQNSQRNEQQDSKQNSQQDNKNSRQQNDRQQQTSKQDENQAKDQQMQRPSNESNEQQAMQGQEDNNDLKQPVDTKSVERWLNRIPDDSTELLRRKFLRDYQRQQSE